MQASTSRRLVQDFLGTAARSSPSWTAPSAAKRPRLSHQRRSAHHRVSLPYDEFKGLPPFLSPEALKLVAVDYQRGLLHRLNDLTRGTALQHSSLLDTVIETSDDRTQVLAFNYASQALNNSFFLTRLTPRQTTLKSGSALSDAIAAEFGSLLGLQHAFSSAAMGMMGSGWIWLVADGAGTLGLVGTYGAGTVLVQNRQQRGEFEAVIGTKESDEEVETTYTTEIEHDKHGRQVRLSDGRRSLHTSALTLAPGDRLTGSPSGAYGYGATAVSRPGRGRRNNDVVIAADLFPLLCLSVHEHAWLTDYGVWGKEAYATNLWQVVDWAALEKTYEQVNITSDPMFTP